MKLYYSFQTEAMWREQILPGDDSATLYVWVCS